MGFEEKEIIYICVYIHTHTFNNEGLMNKFYRNWRSGLRVSLGCCSRETHLVPQTLMGVHISREDEGCGLEASVSSNNGDLGLYFPWRDLFTFQKVRVRRLSQKRGTCFF